MRNRLMLAAGIAVLWTGLAGAWTNPDEHEVDGYWKRNGTYVPPHYQTNPNGRLDDNYGTRGNVNPHTGEPGTRSPNPRNWNPFGLPY